jgi:hypothetical protein
LKNIICAVAILLLSGCASNPLYGPSQQLADSILPEYLEYVKTDPRLDQEQKERRAMAVYNYAELLRIYKEVERR